MKRCCSEGGISDFAASEKYCFAPNQSALQHNRIRCRVKACRFAPSRKPNDCSKKISNNKNNKQNSSYQWKKRDKRTEKKSDGKSYDRQPKLKSSAAILTNTSMQNASPQSGAFFGNNPIITMHNKIIQKNSLHFCTQNKSPQLQCAICGLLKL